MTVGVEQVVVVEPAAVRKEKALTAGADHVNVAICGHEASVAMNDLVFREINLVGSLAYAGDHPDTIALVADGKVDPFQFITGRIDLADIVDKGFRELIDDKEENVKILVRP